MADARCDEPLAAMKKAADPGGVNGLSSFDARRLGLFAIAFGGSFGGLLGGLGGRSLLGNYLCFGRSSIFGGLTFVSSQFFGCRRRGVLFEHLMQDIDALRLKIGFLGRPRDVDLDRHRDLWGARSSPRAGQLP